ncbi:conserved hypothetical protein [Vibrio chagasii]|nr:conserved hypothetical protein [Vibrio chagasii]CAH6849277.1 conserved hypothetical protein [Vibrio chagasii]CAH6854153.1 conserved hypothetical protein [Vibrio chagasii]CAH7055411.1 conserved hypothetical protein [Vibrio chagasii]CAH7096021.1 conserved hypothetical protein [Vibrio chagasii]
MAIYLAGSLTQHRRGRFLHSLLGAQPKEQMPQHGCVLMIGKDYQQLEGSQQTSWREWCQSSGNTLVLIPPYKGGIIDGELDWQVQFTDTPSEVEGELPLLIADEVTQHICAQQGLSERSSGHYWGSNFNTRYFRSHSASGVFAATCLPLWSISLLEKATVVKGWLDELIRLAGEVDDVSDNACSDVIELRPIDYSLLACVFAWQVGDVDAFVRYQASLVVPVFNLSFDEASQGFSRLTQGEYLDGNALSELGLSTLKSSPYWSYAETLKEQVL